MKANKISIVLGIVFVVFACVIPKKQNEKSMVYDLQEIVNHDTLRVATMQGAISYFNFRDETMGFDYEMVNNLAEFLDVEIKFVVCNNISEMAILLQEQKVDIIAYNIAETKEMKTYFDFVFPRASSHLVLVQKLGINTLTDISELNGKKIHVKPNTVYKKRLENLNQEMGNIFEIIEAPDSVSSEELIEMVAQNKIEYSIAYYNMASLYKSQYRQLDIRLALGFEQKNGWLIRKESTALKQKIDTWLNDPFTQRLSDLLSQKYNERSPFFASRRVRIPKGAISPYDHYFKKYAAEINWDWRLLAALAFHESRFDSAQVSRMGASGLMQLMPRTAANFGLDRENILNPAKNIEAGVQYIKSLNLSFRKIENKDERIKFILASYNSGPAHVFDAIELTKKYGKNPQIWFNNVEYYFAKKNEPEFYNDPVVKHGRIRGRETLLFVPNVLGTYERYLNR